MTGNRRSHRGMMYSVAWMAAGLVLSGCFSVNNHVSARTPSVGKVYPFPKGCIWMEFIHPLDDRHCVRDETGKIRFVITPIQREEKLHKQWTCTEFEHAVYGVKDDTFERVRIPGPAAWDYLKPFLRNSDEIWTYGDFDLGTVILRDNKVFCLIVTEHMM